MNATAVLSQEEMVEKLEDAWVKWKLVGTLQMRVYRWFWFHRALPEIKRLTPLLVTNSALLAALFVLLNNLTPVAWKNYELRKENKDLRRSVETLNAQWVHDRTEKKRQAEVRDLRRKVLQLEGDLKEEKVAHDGTKFEVAILRAGMPSAVERHVCPNPAAKKPAPKKKK